MKEYVCSVCGYVHKTDGELPEDFKCPLCGAGKDAFKLKEDVSQNQTFFIFGKWNHFINCFRLTNQQYR